MRKLNLFIGTCIAIVAFVAISASALAGGDPYCESSHDNQFGIYEFDIDTPFSHRAYDISDLTASVYICGTEPTSDPNNGADTLFHHAHIELPPGVQISDTDPAKGGPPYGSLSGTGISNAIGCMVVGFPPFAMMACDFRGNQASTTRTINKSNCTSQRNTVRSLDSDTPMGAIVACHKSEGDEVYNYSWAAYDASGELWFTIGPVISRDNPSAITGITYLNLTLCRYFGGQDGNSCPSSGQIHLWNNGHPSYPIWSNRRTCFDLWGWDGRGIFTITATNRGGETTHPVEKCVVWDPINPWRRGNIKRQGKKKGEI